MKIRYYVIFSILCLMGIILLYVRGANIDKASLWYTMIGDLASALLICGAVSLLQEIFTNVFLLPIILCHVFNQLFRSLILLLCTDVYPRAIKRIADNLLSLRD